jgi:uncharacterized protein YbjT (DUF2867 family)
MKRVLVAGATGYLGGFVAREFKARGYFVRVLVRSPEKLGSLSGIVDEVVQGEVTDPMTLKGVCDGMDMVFSSVGITRQRDGLTFEDVDYRGNLNLLKAALWSEVQKFIYVSVLDGPNLLHLEIVKAHEKFVSALGASRIDHCVIRPTGFFSDMEEYVKMARKGRVYLFGSGKNRINPIHGADLAVTCVEAAEAEAREIDVGGPEVLTHREIAGLAFNSIGKPPRMTSVPLWIMRSVVKVTKLMDKHQGELLSFLTTSMSMDAVAPTTGTRRIGDHFAELESAGRAGKR